MNIASYSVEGIQKFGEYDQFIFVANDCEKVLTNVEIDREAQLVASGLNNLKVRKGDIVGVIVGNIEQIPELMSGILRVGAAFLPIIFMLTPKEIKYILEDSQVRVLITEQKLLPKVKEAAEGNNTLEKIVVIGLDKDEDGRILSYTEFKHQEEPAFEKPLDLGPEALAILMYTSGTTGFPKGVMLTHSNLIENMIQGGEVWPYDSTDTFFTTVPMNHIYGVLGFFEACYHGAKIILVPWFDPIKTLEIITEYKATVAGLVPTMIIMMMQKFDPCRHSLTHMKRLVSAGAPLATETLIEAQEMFGVKIYHGYGCTEAGPTIARQHPEGKFKPGSVGPPIPGVAVRIVNDGEGDVSRGEPGEILVKGPGVMKGYWNNPQETEKTIKGGWLHTGDLGRFDDDGELYIVGRKKDLIIKGGENIDPGVSENILRKHPAVADAATVGIPDLKYGEEVGSAVLLKPGQQTTEGELLGFVARYLHHFSAPKRIFILSSFPTTGTGKVLKREIKDIIKRLSS